MRELADQPKPLSESQAVAIARTQQQQIEQVMAMMKSGTLSQTIANAAIQKAQNELAVLQQAPTD
jgi:hypothetical protein